MDEEQKKPESPNLMENSEQFHFKDGKCGNEIILSSAAYDIYQLANLAADFLKLQPLETKKTPGYT